MQFPPFNLHCVHQGGLDPASYPVQVAGHGPYLQHKEIHITCKYKCLLLRKQNG